MRARARRAPSIRARLALWCALLVTVSGAVVVIGVLALTGAVLHGRAQPPPAPPRPPAAVQSTRASDPAQPSRRPPPQARQQGQVVSETLSQARTIGLIVVGGLALLSIGIGWTVAGRMLRPVQRLVATAHQVSSTTLDRRIASDGPHDELRALADAFDAMLDRLASAFVSQRRFVADASHELRTPLATIRAEVDSMLADPDLGADTARETATRLAAILDRSEALVGALLTLSRADAVTTRRDADLGTIAGEVVTSVPSGGDLDLRLDLLEAPVVGDPTLLERLVANLVENATRYNVAGGMLALTTRTAGGLSVLTVANSGPAIDPDELPALLLRFHRREQDRARAAGGFGLGLAIADSIARGHGGTLELTARPEGGLHVTVTLPAGPLPGVDEPPGTAPSAA